MFVTSQCEISGFATVWDQSIISRANDCLPTMFILDALLRATIVVVCGLLNRSGALGTPPADGLTAPRRATARLSSLNPEEGGGMISPRTYDGHAGGHCQACSNTLTQADCDARGLGLYEFLIDK
jgi:hypothetical protein